MFLNCQWISEDLPHQMRPLAYQVLHFTPGWLFLLQLEMLPGDTVESIGVGGTGFPPDPCGNPGYALQLVIAACVLGFHCLSWKKCHPVCVVVF